jgi:hypothetical protein
MLLIVAGLYICDHPQLFRRHRQQTLRLDTAHTDEEALRSQLELLLGGRVVNLAVKHVDLVNDTTLVDVRYVAGQGVRVEPSPRVERVAS